MRTWLCAAMLAVLLPLTAVAQDPVPPATAQASAVRVFLDCERDCDFDYLRTEMPWVDYVRDRTDADVHVLVTRIGTGGGGSEYTISFAGQGTFATLTNVVRFVNPPGQAESVVRAGLTRTIQLGLVPYVLRTPQAGRLRLSMADDDEGADATVQLADDPWNAWVFEVGADGSIEREEQQRDLEIDGELSASRITPRWKFGVSADGEFSQDRFRLDDDDDSTVAGRRTVTNKRERYGGGAVIIRSLGQHWGAGAQVALSSSTFENTKLAVRAAPAIEYSVWPYDEATRRQLTVQYSMGVSSFNYRELTIFDRLSETRPTQAVVVGYDTRQAWGSADAGLEVANFLDDFAQFRLVFDGGIGLRLIRGLELELGGSASLIRDQLALVKRDATPEEILLELRALRTDYRYSARVGISYTFGSIFNSIVNPRFGTGPGQIIR